MTPALLTFTPFTAADVPLLTRWLQAPHVRAFWDDGERDEAAVAASYGLPDSEMCSCGWKGGRWASSRPWRSAPVGESWAFADHWQERRPGLRRLVIDPDERNVRARRAYEKAGFVAAGMLDGGEGNRRLILTRELP